MSGRSLNVKERLLVKLNAVYPARHLNLTIVTSISPIKSNCLSLAIIQCINRRRGCVIGIDVTRIPTRNAVARHRPLDVILCRRASTDNDREIYLLAYNDSSRLACHIRTVRNRY